MKNNSITCLEAKSLLYINKNKAVHWECKSVLFLIMFLLLSINSAAHGDLIVRISKKTEEILKSPNNSRLYFERGLLYQQHIEYIKAKEDYKKSKSLGNTSKDLTYRIAEVDYLTKNYSIALKSVTLYLESYSRDVQGRQLEAQILFNLKHNREALKSYRYVMKNKAHIRPEDVLEYCNIILVENSKNYNKALRVLKIGLKQLGSNTLSLQLKKIEYLENSNKTKKVLKQYNYFIVQYSRKEFWYFKKAKYLVKINKNEEANIALQLAKANIEGLDAKFKNTKQIVNLKDQIIILENLNNKKL
jgi:uncharacterized protein YneR